MVHYLLWRLGLAAPETQLTLSEQDCLRRYARDRRVLVEIGVWHGVTTRLLREVMADDASLMAVDPFAPGRLGFSPQRVIAGHVVSRSSRGSVEFLRMTGADAAALYASRDLPPVDFVFVDGDHSIDAVTEDWEGWSPLVRAGGIVVLHDSRSSLERKIDDAGSAVFTREVIRHDERFEVIDEIDTVTVVRRIGD